jgi:hypothetical protein
VQDFINKKRTKVISTTVHTGLGRPKERNLSETNIAVQLNNTQKREFLFVIHYESLKISFLDETQLPALEGRSASVKDLVTFLCFQISHAPSMNISMKNLLLK